VTFASKLIHPANYHPFAPNGWPGILTGGRSSFSPTLDSIPSPPLQRSVRTSARPALGIIATLVACTLLYIAVVVVLTGLVSGHLVDDAAPVVNTLKKLHSRELLDRADRGSEGMISSLLVFQLGQAPFGLPMSRDGLFPKFSAACTRVFATQIFSTWMAGFVVGIPAGLLDFGTLADLFEHRHAICFCPGRRRRAILRYREPDRRAPSVHRRAR